jgi:hypothetical protein
VCLCSVDAHRPVPKRHAGPRPSNSGHHGPGGWGEPLILQLHRSDLYLDATKNQWITTCQTALPQDPHVAAVDCSLSPTDVMLVEQATALPVSSATTTKPQGRLRGLKEKKPTVQLNHRGDTVVRTLCTGVTVWEPTLLPVLNDRTQT